MHSYDTIRLKLISLAARTTDKALARDRTHVALDCAYAAEGCANSAESVAEWLSFDGELADALDWDARAEPELPEIEARPAHYTLGVAA